MFFTGTPSWSGRIPLWLCDRLQATVNCRALTKAGNFKTGAAAFLRFIKTYGISLPEAFPVSDRLLAYWAHWLAAEGKSYNSIKGYFYDLVGLQLSYLQGPTIDRSTTPLFNLVLKELKSSPHPSLLRLPIERQHLALIRSSLDINSPEGATIWAACCSAFYGLMRIGEFTTKDGLLFSPSWQAKRSDCTKGWDPESKRPYFVLHLPRTKTGVADDVYLGFSGAFDCPFTALAHMFRVVPSSSPSDPAFNLGPRTPLFRDTFVAAIRLPLERAGCGRGIHGHSFRIGGATLLAAAGVPEHVIKLAGRWQSNAFLVYVRQHYRFIPQTVAVAAALPFPLHWHSKSNDCLHTASSSH